MVVGNWVEMENFSCQLCGTGSKSKGALLAHLKECSEDKMRILFEKYQCDQCENTFLAKHLLLVHINSCAREQLQRLGQSEHDSVSRDKAGDQSESRASSSSRDRAGEQVDGRSSSRDAEAAEGRGQYEIMHITIPTQPEENTPIPDDDDEMDNSFGNDVRMHYIKEENAVTAAKQKLKKTRAVAKYEPRDADDGEMPPATLTFISDDGTIRQVDDRKFHNGIKREKQAKVKKELKTNSGGKSKFSGKKKAGPKSKSKLNGSNDPAEILPAAAAAATSSTFKCASCGKNYASDQGLRLHDESKHQGIKYPCNSCEKTFTQKSHWKKHVKTSHDDTDEV